MRFLEMKTRELPIQRWTRRVPWQSLAVGTKPSHLPDWGADIRKKLQGPTNQKYAEALGEVATILSGEEKCEEAIALERQALVIS